MKFDHMWFRLDTGKQVMRLQKTIFTMPCNGLEFQPETGQNIEYLMFVSVESFITHSELLYAFLGFNSGHRENMLSM